MIGIVRAWGKGWVRVVPLNLTEHYLGRYLSSAFLYKYVARSVGSHGEFSAYSYACLIRRLSIACHVDIHSVGVYFVFALYCSHSHVKYSIHTHGKRK